MSIIVNITGQNISKHFFTNVKIGNKKYCLVPKDENVFKYYKYIKNFYNPFNGYYYFDKIKNFEDCSKFDNKNTQLFNNDILEFEFPDDYSEEELFYFKMKYV